MPRSIGKLSLQYCTVIYQLMKLDDHFFKVH